MSDWKPIDELPPQAGDYLVLLGDGQMAVGYFDAWKTWGCSGVHQTYDGCGGVAFDAAPAQWMPLPAPPAGKSA